MTDYRVGDKVRFADDPNYAGGAVGTVAEIVTNSTPSNVPFYVVDWGGNIGPVSWYSGYQLSLVAWKEHA